MPLALGQSNPDVGSSPSFCSGRKLGDISNSRKGETPSNHYDLPVGFS